jgi:hypothetical protein
MVVHTSSNYTHQIMRTKINMNRILITLACILTISDGAIAQQNQKQNKPEMVLEIRSYNLKPGTRDEFNKLVEKTMPLLKQYKIEVVAYGPSMHDETSYFLMRSFTSKEQRDILEDVFYGSEDWKKGNREEVLSRIESYTTVVIPASKVMIDAYVKAINGN